MNVEQLLSGKGHDVISVQPHRTLSEAIRTLSEKRIGAVVVMGADGALVGILSERDIIRALGELGAGALESAVSRSMTSKVVTCRPQTSVDELMEIMTTGRFRHVPVVENGRVTGLVSIGDVVKHRVAAIEAESQAMRDYIAMA
ncbi:MULTISPECIES: CBS domain-containing protein [Bosea]|jgi:CBS domain-containing protein|uniref:CBS domain-containing protein n=1 Tax=Bosea TaxID=85413 RepID=UPI00214FA2F1|nr:MULTISPECIES: CBS domain-containing protein [Bosea]MCR4521006.1 CBS domain-containing protein [Bosea sp. 47.2.35]MDR6830651.1 CBS domain-containing protein [Bosea robiniae]MDR6897532.1 CBS domain-containing protein [Bosea sp. BE109]MDR7140929.1 CBS domain-containing protein [Bosea sp. BE168]MDR7177551.1 CBS domain-containing protein [Bosea sp. BE271]